MLFFFFLQIRWIQHWDFSPMATSVERLDGEALLALTGCAVLVFLNWHVPVDVLFQKHLNCVNRHHHICSFFVWLFQFWGYIRGTQNLLLELHTRITHRSAQGNLRVSKIKSGLVICKAIHTLYYHSNPHIFLNFVLLWFWHHTPLGSHSWLRAQGITLLRHLRIL